MDWGAVNLFRRGRNQAASQSELDGSSGSLIELHQVVKTFKNAAGEFTVLKGIDAAFRESEFVSVVGRSGSGKSTLLNMMTGIDHPTTGTVRVGKVYLHTLSEGQMSVWRGRNMGIVFQFFQLLPMLTLLENVMLPMDFCDMYAPAEREDRACQLLREVDLAGFEHKYPAAVSGGQQQSAAVARALANDPPILVADEPTGNLDTRTAELILTIFEQQVAGGKTVIMVTHDNTLALRANRRLVISDGELVNEWVSIAFPQMPHNLLLALSHQVEPMTLQPNEDLNQAAALPALMIITEGQVEVLKAGRSSPIVLDHLQPGDAYIPQYAAYPTDAKKTLLGSLRSDAPALTLRAAAGQPVRALTLDRPSFDQLTAESGDLAVQMEQIMLNRAQSTIPEGKGKQPR